MQPLFRFSCINHAMLSQNPADSINLFYNQQRAYNDARAMMFMAPTFNTACYDYPEFNLYGNNLLNPMLAIQQTLRSFQNGSWMNGCNFANMFNNMFQNSWWNNINTNKNNSNKNLTDAQKVELKQKEREYENLKALLEAYKNTSGASQANIDKVQVALDNNGSVPANATDAEKALQPIDRKLRALKDVYKQLPKADLRKAMSSIQYLQPELELAGYNFQVGKYSYKYVRDTDFIAKIDRIHSEISGITDSNIAATEYSSLIEPLTGSGDKNDILRIVSYWNDKYNDSKERNIINFIVEKLPAGKEKDVITKHVKPLVDALNAKAAYVKESASFSASEKKSLDDNVSALVKAYEAAKDKATLKTVAANFETLYAQLRMMEAARINKEMKDKYSFLNDIAADDVDFVNDDLIVEDTKEDLRAEKISKISNPIIENNDNAGTELTKEVLERDGQSVRVEYTNSGVKIDAYKYDDKIYRIDRRNNRVIDITDKVKVIGGAPASSSAPVTPAPAAPTAPVAPVVLDAETVKTGEKTTIDNKDFYKYENEFYLVKGNDVIKGEKIVATKDGSKLTQRSQNYYKYDGVIYKIKDGKIEKAPAYIKEST